MYSLIFFKLLIKQLQFIFNLNLLAISYNVYIRIMQVEEVQKCLMEGSMEFGDRKKLIQYYVGFQFPEKQQALALWWIDKIKQVLIIMGEVYVTPIQLKLIFSINGLKPSPLQSLLNYYQEKGDILWRQKPMKENPGFMSGMVSYFWGSSSKQSALDNSTSRIIHREYYNEIIEKILQIIHKLDEEKGHCLQYKYVEQVIKSQLSITTNSIQYILGDMNENRKIVMDSIGNERVIMFTKFTQDMIKPAWAEVEKNKYLLNLKIEEFSKKIDLINSEERNILEAAKEEINQGRKANIKQKYIVPAQAKRRKARALRTRLILLEDTLHRLQTQQIDNITIQMMSTCQQILNKNMKDPAQLQQLVIKSKENKQKQEQVNRNMKMMVEDDVEDDVNGLLEELQVEISKQKKQKIAKKQVEADIELNHSLEKMDIEEKQNKKDIDFVQN